ncbi:MAG: hypothetical protein GF328_11180, partial [Candidatus Latescibacteria bacterium]|nr:hypothetical protein [Candidatus Latescibacterota bacterium]
MSEDRLPDGADLHRQLEEIEIALYRDLYAAVPPEVADRHGIRFDQRDDGTALTAREPDHPFFNRVLGVGLRRPPDGEWIDAQIARFESIGTRRWMLQIPPHLETPGLRDALARRGLVRHRGWAKHVGVPGDRAHRGTDLRIEAIDRSRGAIFAQICVAAFGVPSSFEPWIAASVGRPQWVHFLAFDRDEPVACAALFLAGSDAVLNFAATREEARGRGA